MRTPVLWDIEAKDNCIFGNAKTTRLKLSLYFHPNQPSHLYLFHTLFSTCFAKKTITHLLVVPCRSTVLRPLKINVVKWTIKKYVYVDILLEQGSQTQIIKRATFQRRHARRAAVYWRKASVGHKELEKLSNYAKFNYKLTIYLVFEMRAGHTNAYGRPHAADGPRVLDPCTKGNF